ncbi:Conserved_hypothetical protein [Hexamita inflata]|uniref:Transmembrane protein n=1 Tax=Hexamita inflata TaxID=28002 RepID=A0AA86Q989_9EUKA|nr:Conserved hypothetical protein [Hexamita inflata]
MLCIKIAYALLVLTMKEIPECYVEESSLEYRPNINQLVINLVSGNLAACNKFPDGIDVNVTLGEVNPVNPLNFVPPISRTITNFNYKTTTQLFINTVLYKYSNVPDLSAFQFTQVFVEIYSYAEITTISINKFSESRSSLTDCFYANTSINIEPTFLHVHLHATGLCQLQITHMANLQILSSGEIIDFPVSSNPDLQLLKLNYAANVAFYIVLPGAYMYLWSASVIKSRVQLDNSNSEIEFQFNSITFESVSNLFTVQELSRADGGFYVRINQNAAVMSSFVSSIGLYDSFQFRVNFVDQAFVLSRTFKQFDPTNQLYFINCSVGSESEQCFSQHQLMQKSVVSAVLELVFYQDQTVLKVQKTELAVKQSIFQQIIINKNGIAFVNATEKITSSNVKVTLSKVINDQIVLDQNCVFNLKEVIVDWSGKTLSQNERLVIKYEINDKQYQSIVHEVDWDDYQRMTIVATVIGAGSTIFCVVVTVIGVGRVSRNIKQMKKKRNNVNI